MGLKPEVREETRQAVQSFHEYAANHGGRERRLVPQFCRERPREAQVLVEVYDATHPGLNHLASRKLTRAATKVRVALEDAEESNGAWCTWTRWIRRHQFLLSVLVLVLILPILLSPTHPLAVYGYLAASYDPSMIPQAFAYSGSDLTGFLTSPAQVRRYRTDLLEDMMNRRSSRLFIIVRCPDGTLRQEPLRTWNGFLPTGLPRFASSWLDRKELPYLGDQVDTWLRGNTIVAMGHYHAFGGAPSPGDTAAQYFCDLPEIVVVNGVVPMVYLDGHVISYAEEVVVSEEVFRSMRTVERTLTMDVTQSFSWPEMPSPALRSFLGFLRDYQGVDVSRAGSVASGVRQLCVQFKDYYRPVFPEGYVLAPYTHSADLSNFLQNLQNLHGWANIAVLTRESVPGYETGQTACYPDRTHDKDCQ